MFNKIIYINILSIGLAACDAFQANATVETASETAAASSAPVAPKKNLLEDRDTLIAAQTHLQALPHFAGKPVQIFGNIDFYDGVQPRIELSVQSPINPDDIWLLKYEHGKWSSPMVDEEEELNAAQIAPHLTPLSDIHFEDAIHAAQLWRTKAAEVNAVWQEPYHVAFIWMPKLKKRFWHTAEIDAVGAQYYLSLNLDGSIWEWKKL